MVEKENEDLDARDGGKAKVKAAGSKGGGGSSSKGDGASRCVFWAVLPLHYCARCAAGYGYDPLQQDLCGTARASVGTLTCE